MKFINRTFALLAFALFFSSCQEDIVKCGPEYIAATDFTAYWRFPTGSNWIYKLDTSVDIYDTVTGANRIFYGNYNPDGGPCDFRIYQQFLQHSNLKYFIPSDTVTNSSVEMLFSNPDNILNHYTSSRSLFSYDELVKYPYKIGDSIRNSRLASIKLNSIDTFNSAFGKFDSTIHLTSTPPVPYLNLKHFTDMYLAKNVGIVKITYTNGEVWNLIKYEIKK
jgi:hypothetical protein